MWSSVAQHPVQTIVSETRTFIHLYFAEGTYAMTEDVFSGSQMVDKVVYCAFETRRKKGLFGFHLFKFSIMYLRIPLNNKGTVLNEHYVKR
jgi:hypothetical protein